MLMRVINEDRIFNIVVNSFIIIALIIVLYPLYFIVIASISDPVAVNTGEILFLPKRISFGGYQAIFEDERIIRGYTNTIFYTTAGTTLNVLLTLLAGYALSRKDLAGRGVIMGILVFTMYFRGGLIPTFLVVKSLGIYNTPWVMILLNAVGIWNLIICRTYFTNTISDELLEAAFIDGCKNEVFFFRIVLPLSKAIVGVMVLYYAVGHWNQYFNAMIYLNKPKLYPLQLVLREILINSNQIQNEIVDFTELSEKDRMAESIKYGVIIVSSLPVLMLYPFAQKYFVKGVMIGSVKG